MKKFFTGLMALPTIVCLILLGCYKFQLAGQTEWITLVAAWLSSTATIVLGVIVFFQTENHKKRSEEDNAIYLKEEQKAREQALCLRAIPSLIYKGIDNLIYSKKPIIVNNEEIYNKLADINIEGCYQFSNLIYFNLNFNKLYNALVDSIYVSDAFLFCEETNYKKHFKNISKQEHIANIKISKNGVIQVIVDLLIDSDDTLLSLLKNEKYTWALSINLISSNAFNVQIKYEAFLEFQLGIDKADGEEVHFNIKQNNNRLLQESNVYLNKEGENK